MPHVDSAAPSSVRTATLTSTHLKPKYVHGRRCGDANGERRTAKISLHGASPHLGFNRRLIISTETTYLRIDYVHSESADTCRLAADLVNFMTYPFRPRGISPVYLGQHSHTE